ncbi:MAG: hypothetical protein HND44_14580 [Chloroflexi bacterium]|nr:hypothetical protein [Ardenticatenaceae bacterium]MBL1129689.1 hypothetical protein [Chloroflexota bacterium]NOG35770.1 hypothetical protein [Chloroflexota bacterium]GIK58822.1 MAG: hypothetical protein BroJett015_44850 [Chloroflexota bacterium]
MLKATFEGQNRWVYLALTAVLLATVLLYASSLAFGFIWDDPLWFGHALGKAWWQTLLPNADFQFYRPLTMLYFWLFHRADGTFAIETAHGFQLGFHLLNVALAFAIGRRLGLGRGVAVAVAALFAFYPMAYQAVAWAAPQQPLTAVWQNVAWLGYFWARPLPPLFPPRHSRWGLIASFVFFILALTTQESSVTVAVVPLLYELLLRRSWAGGRLSAMPADHRGTEAQSSKRTPFVPSASLADWLRPYTWALVYPVLAAGYVLVWLAVPRKAGITGVFFDGRNLAYVLQGFAFPLFGRPQGYAPGAVWPEWVVAVLALAMVAVLLGLAAWRGRGRVALFGFAWALAAVLPMLVGLGFAYVALAARLLYAPAMGICLLWGCALWPRAGERRWVQVGSVLAMGLILLQSVWLLRQFEGVWRQGTDHLRAAVAALDEVGDGRYLFLNFPDRYAPTRPPYPVGYWGLTLAPVVVELADFQRVWTGRQAQTVSQAMPWLDQAERENGDYAVDMRGVIIQPDELATLAAEVDGVYVSRYGADGRWQWQYAGRLEPGAADGCPFALIGEDICLHEAQVVETVEGYEVTLVWSTAVPLPPHLTIFAHLGQPGQPPVAQADGDTWRGALPMANWPPGVRIVEQRTLPRTAQDGLSVQVGVYNWVDGQRVGEVEVSR